MNTTPTQQCRALEALLPLLDRPDMPAAQSAEARAHLNSCAYCQEQRAAYLRLDAAARRLLSPPAMPISQTEDILRDLLRSDAAEIRRAAPALPRVPPASPPGRPARPGQARRFLSGLASLAAVLVIALLVTALLLNHARPGTPGTGASATSSPPAATAGEAGQLLDIAMVSPTEGWAVGSNNGCMSSPCPEKPLLMHYLNGKWLSVTLPFSGGLSNLSMISATDGWASGGNLLLRYDGHTWKQQPNPDNLNFEKIQMFSDTAGWAVAVGEVTGKQASTADATGLYFYDGHTWTLQSLPVSVFAALYTSDHWDTFSWGTFSMLSPTEGWASITLQQSNAADAHVGVAILHYSGGHWALQATYPNAQLNSISMTSATDGWAVGNTLPQKQEGTPYEPTILLLHYSQGKWVQAENLPPIGCCPGTVAMRSASDGWIISSGYSLLHYLGDHWDIVNLPTSDSGAGRLITALAMTSDNEGWAVGVQKNLEARTAQDPTFNLVILHYLNGTWSIVFG